MRNKNFDFKSIKFKLWTYFIGFAMLILLLIWALQIIFLNNYYSAMKQTQTAEISNDIQNKFAASKYDKALLEKTVSK